jgi:hypothetical protein
MSFVDINQAKTLNTTALAQQAYTALILTTHRGADEAQSAAMYATPFGLSEILQVLNDQSTDIAHSGHN